MRTVIVRGVSLPVNRSIDAAPLLSMRISAGYRGRADVLHDAAFEIEAGEIVGLAGQSGSGKSTIALAIMRLLHLKDGAMRGQILFAAGICCSAQSAKCGRYAAGKFRWSCRIQSLR